MSREKNVSVAILAGGKSTRMGTDKATLKLGERTFIATLADEFSFSDDLMISVAKNSQCITDFKIQTNIKLVYDQSESSGPLEGIVRCLESSKNDFVFVCAVDMPLLKKELFFYIKEFISSDFDIYCVKDENHVHPLCAVYSKKILPVAAGLLNQKKFKLMELLNSSRTKYIDLKYTNFSSEIVRNVNTPEDVGQLSRRPFVFCVSGLKKSGKTWLVQKLVKMLTDEGFSVGTVKHDGHDFSVDDGETDSAKFYRAGAKFSAIFSKNQWNIHGRAGNKTDATESFLINLKKLPAVDVVIIEGMKNSELPKIVIEKSSEKWEGQYKNVLALIEDFDEESVVNVYEDVLKSRLNLR